MKITNLNPNAEYSEDLSLVIDFINSLDFDIKEDVQISNDPEALVPSYKDGMITLNEPAEYRKRWAAYNVAHQIVFHVAKSYGIENNDLLKSVAKAFALYAMIYQGWNIFYVHRLQEQKTPGAELYELNDDILSILEDMVKGTLVKDTINQLKKKG